VRKEMADLVALLTPIVKGFITEQSYVSTTLGMQVFGGHGYIKEWGMEQYVRDARINMIYEGTNGIQALDLLGRKVLGDMGAKLTKFGKLVTEFVKSQSGNEAMKEFTGPLAELGTEVQKVTMEIGQKAMKNADEVGAASVAYMCLVGHLVYSYLWARMASLSLEKAASDEFYKSKLLTARFYFAKLLPETAMHLKTIRSGSESLMALEVAGF
jgi:acyl-CoA dehydrogenase